jgi:KaiC/GvpD/RAD55 family RecA-like ATPase
MRALLNQIIAIQDMSGAKRAVIDSSTSLGFHLQDPAKIRIELLKLSTTLEILGLTSFMTCETIDDTLYSRFGVENFVTEGTIMLYNRRYENVRVRSMEIFKMRGSDHSKGIHPYEITSDGIVIHPHEEVY